MRTCLQDGHCASVFRCFKIQLLQTGNSRGKEQVSISLSVPGRTEPRNIILGRFDSLTRMQTLDDGGRVYEVPSAQQANQIGIHLAEVSPLARSRHFSYCGTELSVMMLVTRNRNQRDSTFRRTAEKSSALARAGVSVWRSGQRQCRNSHRRKFDSISKVSEFTQVCRVPMTPLVRSP